MPSCEDGTREEVVGEFPLAQLAQLAELCRDETAELILLRPEDRSGEAGEQTHLGWKEAAERIGVERQQCDAGIAPSSGGIVPLKSFWLGQTLAPSLCVGIVPLMEFPMRDNSASTVTVLVGRIVPLSLS